MKVQLEANVRPSKAVKILQLKPTGDPLRDLQAILKLSEDEYGYSAVTVRIDL